MTKNKSAKEDGSGNGSVGNSAMSVARAKRDRESGSEGSPNSSKKPAKSSMLSVTLPTVGSETVDGGRED